MPEILTTGSKIECPHGGKVSLTGTTKLTVASEKAILKSETSGWAVSDCKTVEDTSKGIITCRKVASITTGEAKKLNVNGVAVMLSSTAGFTDGKPPPTGSPISVSAEQTKLSAS